MKKHASAAPRHPEDPSRTSEPGRSDSASAPLPDVPHLRTAKQRRLEPLAFIFDAVQVQRQPQTAPIPLFRSFPAAVASSGSSASSARAQPRQA